MGVGDIFCGFHVTVTVCPICLGFFFFFGISMGGAARSILAKVFFLLFVFVFFGVRTWGIERGIWCQ